MINRFFNLLAVLLVLPSCAIAQEEVFPTGTVWKEVREELFMPENPEYHTPMDTLRDYVYEIGTDTIIGQKTYKKVFKDNALWDCVIREEGGCVWMLADGYTQEFKLYDFNWEGRDTIVTQFLHEEVTNSALVYLDNDYFPLDSLKVEQEMQIADSFNRIIIRGIGCVAELDRKFCLLGHRMRWEPSPSLMFFRVLWLRKNGKEVYRYHGKNEWTTGMANASVASTSPASPDIFYDLQGRRLAVEPRKGLYIRDGRKMVVK